MLRIVGLQRSEEPAREFLLLQNQGSLRVLLRGHVLLTETAIGQGIPETGLFVFPDDVHIPAGLYVLLATGRGCPNWAKTRDGLHVYQTYMGLDSAFWSSCQGPVRVLGPGHTFTERREALLLG